MLRAISAYAFNVISQQSTLSERHAFRAGWHRERGGGGALHLAYQRCPPYEKFKEISEESGDQH